jgi:superfamily I DNA/RNA helicase
MEKKREAMAYPLRILAKYGPEGLRDEPRVTIGTIHSTKGAEATEVLLFPDLSVAGAKEWLGSQDKYDRDNVVRTFYVGMTRAKDTLYLAHDAGGLHVSWDVPEY